MIRRYRSHGEKSRGQTLVEFSMVIPLFLLLVLVIAEGGYYVVATTIVSSATHEGARLGVLETTSSRANIRARVKDSAAPVVAISDAQITLSLDGSNCDNACYQARAAGQSLEVATSYSHVPLVGYVFPGVTFPANAVAELTVEGTT